MKRIAGILCILASMPAAAAPALSVGMNGEYRCENGKTFVVKVRSSAVMGGMLVFPATTEFSGNGAGVVVPAFRHEVEVFDLHGASVLLDGKRYKLMLHDGDGLVLRDRRKKLQWEIGSAETPFSGRLSGKDGLLGENCVLAAPTRIN